MANAQEKGRVTIPTDTDMVEKTLEIMKKWGADAVRDCDGTEFPEELARTGAKVYATYYTTRKDNEWAKENPDEIQQCYVMSKFHTAFGNAISIRLLDGLSQKMLKVNYQDDIARWWEVMDRTTGKPLPADNWEYSHEDDTVIICKAMPFHEYTVSFLAYLIWDPVHMYNTIVNEWNDEDHQLTIDVCQPKSRRHMMERLHNFIETHPYVDVIRYTSFFHQFTLLFDDQLREKYVDWYGYSASVSPHMLEQFEKEVGYKFRPEYIIDQGYYNNQYRIPSKEYLDFMAFQRRKVAKLAREIVQITHENNKEAMMFLGDHWIGTEPYMDEFQLIGLDAVVGSVGNGSTLRLLSDIKGVRYIEGRLLPYFFKDTFCEGGDPVKEAKENWMRARRALLRKPIDRIGYGGYLKLACDFPDFVEYVAQVCDDFRRLYENIHNSTPFCFKKVAVLNCWGKMRSWGCHMVHHAIYYKQNYSYAGIIEALSGAPFDVSFISFDDIKTNPAILDDLDILINVGDADTAHTGGFEWEEPAILSAIRNFVDQGGGVIGVGEPSGHLYQGHFFQIKDILGVDKETGMTLGYDKYNWDEHAHFITEDCNGPIDFGEGGRYIYAAQDTVILAQRENEVQLAVHEFGKGRAVYIGGLPYSTENTRLLHRVLLWSTHAEQELHRWFCTNSCTEVNAYPEKNLFCVANNTFEVQETTVYRGDGSDFSVKLEPCEIKWYSTDSN